MDASTMAIIDFVVGFAPHVECTKVSKWEKWIIRHWVRWRQSAEKNEIAREERVWGG
jgi:hypothetical protein